MTIKVLHLIDSGGLYGAEMMLLNLVEEQVKSGLKPLILSAGTPEIEEKAIEVEARKRGLPVKAVRMKAGINIVKAFRIVSFAKKEGFDVLHSHGYKFDILLGMLPKRVRRIPVVTTVHGYIVAKKLSKISLYQWLDRFLIRNFDRIIFVNKSMLAQKFFNKNRFRRLSIINNGINIKRDEGRILEQKDYSPGSEILQFIEEGSPLFGFVGRLSHEKGTQDLLYAFSELVDVAPEARLLVIGDGAYKDELRNLVHELALGDKVKLIGYTDKTYYYLSKLDLLVLPSHTEGLPIVLLEAMFAECLILATKVGGMPDALKDGELGFLVEPEDKKKLACKLKDIGERLKKGEQFNDLQCASKVEVLERFSSKKMSSAYRLIYQGVLDANELEMR